MEYGLPLAIHPLATFNAVLNGIAAVLLVVGWVLIARGNWKAHRAVMIAAFFSFNNFSHLISGLPLSRWSCFVWRAGADTSGVPLYFGVSYHSGSHGSCAGSSHVCSCVSRQLASSSATGKNYLANLVICISDRCHHLLHGVHSLSEPRESS